MRYFSNADLAKILNKDIFLNISEVADSLGVECYVIGGYVRDLFLERENKDIDVVVIGSGIQVAEGLKKKLGRKAHVSTFRNFGTAQVKYKTISETNTITILANLSLKKERWKTTKNVVISLSTHWLSA